MRKYREKAGCCVNVGDSVLTKTFGFLRVLKVEPDDIYQSFVWVEFHGLSGKSKLQSTKMYLCREG